MGRIPWYEVYKDIIIKDVATIVIFWPCLLVVYINAKKGKERREKEGKRIGKS
jgi:hypothetical protein